MNTAAYFSAPKTLRRIHAGPLGPYVDEFASWLQEQHYSRSSGQTSVRAVANWSRWLQVRDIAGISMQNCWIGIFCMSPAPEALVRMIVGRCKKCLPGCRRSVWHRRPVFRHLSINARP